MIKNECYEGSCMYNTKTEEPQKYTAIIVITPKDFTRLVKHYTRMVNNLPAEKILFVSGAGIENELRQAELGESVSFFDENKLISFDKVRDCMSEHLRPLLGDEPVPRGAIGWYYQQFLKMEFSRVCEDRYYMSWDGDTIPCAPFSMFQEGTGAPYLDLKQEYHALYFETLEKILPGMRKVIGKSFISEHMLFDKDIMQELIHKIESNDSIPGKYYWEKIIHAISPEQISNSGFSEFETYGTYVAYTRPSIYKLREWHSFRLAGEFFDPDTICDRDFEWLAKDFYAISFEKNQVVREDHKNIFDNPEYQKKLSARMMLEIAQKEFNGGYIEVWGDTKGAVGVDPLTTGQKTSKENEFEEMVSSYKSRVQGNFGLVQVEGLSYINYASDVLIMAWMYAQKRNWADEDMRRFYSLSCKHYPQVEGRNLFLDIGANIGTTCIYFKKMIDPSVKIIAFEPAEKNYRMLKANFLLNEIDEQDYKVERLALSDEEGETEFVYDSVNSGGSRALHGEKTGKNVNVATTTLDGYIQRGMLDAAKIKYIWVDIEGFEPYFLRGAEATLKSIDVPMVMEFSPENYRRDGVYMECIDILCRIYDSFIYMHDENEKLHPIDELYRYEDSNQLVDLFFVKRR